MCIQQRQLQQRLQIDLVNNWHERWSEILDAIDHLGQRNALNIDSDGWLSARQNLLVAFRDDAVAGHLCFRVEPGVQDGKRVVDAHLEARGVQPGFPIAEIEAELIHAANQRARALRCRQLVA